MVWNYFSTSIFNIENCAVELTFMEESDTLRDTLNIVGTNSYEDGILVADFENGLPSDALVSWTSNIGFRTFDISNDDPIVRKCIF